MPIGPACSQRLHPRRALVTMRHGHRVLPSRDGPGRRARNKHTSKGRPTGGRDDDAPRGCRRMRRHGRRAVGHGGSPECIETGSTLTEESGLGTQGERAEQAWTPRAPIKSKHAEAHTLERHAGSVPSRPSIDSRVLRGPDSGQHPSPGREFLADIRIDHNSGVRAGHARPGHWGIGRHPADTLSTFDDINRQR